MSEIYCKKCQYYEMVFDYCNCPYNIAIDKEYDDIYTRHIDSPARLNANNDCKWFKAGILLNYQCLCSVKLIIEV